MGYFGDTVEKPLLINVFGNDGLQRITTKRVIKNTSTFPFPKKTWLKLYRSNALKFCSSNLVCTSTNKQ